MKFNYFVPENFSTFVDDCRKALSVPEPALFYSFPFNGIERRIDQIVQDHATSFDQPLVHIRLSSSFEDPSDIELYLKQKNLNLTNGSMYLFVSNVEFLIQTKNSGLFQWLDAIQTKNQHIRIIFFSELYVSPQIMIALGLIHIVGNVRYFPLYSASDAKMFTLYLCDKWQMKLSEKKANSIVRQCGGHFWFIKEAVRILRDSPTYSAENLLEHEAVRYRLSALNEFFDEKDRAIIYDPRTAQFPNHRQYLEKIGLIKNNTCTFPLLFNYMHTHWKKVKMVLKNAKIYCNDVLIDQLFSKTEKNILKYFLTHTHRPVPREDIGNIAWKDHVEEKYSDWAIDQIINRLRKKLQTLGIGKNAIKTVRSFGYTFNY